MAPPPVPMEGQSFSSHSHSACPALRHSFAAHTCRRKRRETISPPSVLWQCFALRARLKEGRHGVRRAYVVHRGARVPTLQGPPMCSPEQPVSPGNRTEFSLSAPENTKLRNHQYHAILTPFQKMCNHFMKIYKTCLFFISYFISSSQDSYSSSTHLI